jgi:hypothetical protein
MKRKPASNRLILGGNLRGSVACRQSDKSTNCHVATELRGRTIDTRMKPDWLNDSPVATVKAMTKDSYIRHTVVLFSSRLGKRARTDHSTTAISGTKDVRRIRQSIKLIVITHTKWGLPKPKRRMAIEFALEYSAWQRSFHSSPSKGKPCTWRRKAADNFNTNQKNT